MLIMHRQSSIGLYNHTISHLIKNGAARVVDCILISSSLCFCAVQEEPGPPHFLEEFWMLFLDCFGSDWVAVLGVSWTVLFSRGVFPFAFLFFRTLLPG